MVFADLECCDIDSKLNKHEVVASISRKHKQIDQLNAD